MLRASCFMLEIKEFRCYEAKKHWQLKPEVSWVQILAAAGIFTFLSFHLIKKIPLECVQLSTFSPVDPSKLIMPQIMDLHD